MRSGTSTPAVKNQIVQTKIRRNKNKNQTTSCVSVSSTINGAIPLAVNTRGLLTSLNLLTMYTRFLMDEVPRWEDAGDRSPSDAERTMRER